MGNFMSKRKSSKARNHGSKPSTLSPPAQSPPPPRQASVSSTKRFDSQPPTYEPTYENSCTLLSNLVHRRENRHSLVKLRGHEAQSMVDFLQRVLDRSDFSGPVERTEVLHTLSSLAREAQVVPECLKLTGVKCEFNPLVHHGAYGDIYRGKLANRSVCVKAIHVSPNHTEDNQEQLLRIHAKEAILLAHMVHKNILPFAGLYLPPDQTLRRLCIISTWMDNGDLWRYLKKNPDAPRQLLMSDIIFGLQYLHEFGIIHSDLKAKNVLISDEGRALLADFGASRVAMSITTRTTSSVGEANWMAPELLLGEVESANLESDIWAFACVCYEILSGTMPFAEFAHNTTALIKAFSKSGTIPTKPTTTVDSRIWRKMEKCWDYLPAKRPTAAEICHFFTGLGMRDDRPQFADNSRVRTDNTTINFEVVHKALLQVSQSSP